MSAFLGHSGRPSEVKDMLRALGDRATGSSAQLDLILQHLLALGCRCPAEPTMKFVTSWWLCMSEAPESLMAMSAPTKHAMLRGTKRSFDRLRRMAPAPPVHIARLPHAPSEFLRDYPTMYAAAFGDKSPVAFDGLSCGLEFGNLGRCVGRHKSAIAHGGGRHLCVNDRPEGMPRIQTTSVEGNILAQVRMVDMSFTCRRSREVPLVAFSANGPGNAGAMERIAAQILEGQQRMLAAMMGEREKPVPINFAPVRRAPTLRLGEQWPTPLALRAQSFVADTPPMDMVESNPPAEPPALSPAPSAGFALVAPPTPATPSALSAPAAAIALATPGTTPRAECPPALAAPETVGQQAFDFMNMLDLERMCQQRAGLRPPMRRAAS